jgi:hypothetical protein
VLATAGWTGGLVAISLVARVAGRTLPPRERVTFFRGLGRAYGLVGGVALIAALGCAAALLCDRAWDDTLTAAAVIATCLVAATAAGVMLARRMTRLRQEALRRPGDTNLAARIGREALGAAALRAAIAVLSLALLALGVLIAP